MSGLRLVLQLGWTFAVVWGNGYIGGCESRVILEAPLTPLAETFADFTEPSLLNASRTSKPLSSFVPAAALATPEKQVWPSQIGPGRKLASSASGKIQLLLESTSQCNLDSRCLGHILFTLQAGAGVLP